MSTELAILGGPKAVQAPAPPWPQGTEEIVEAVAGVLRGGSMSETWDRGQVLELEEQFKGYLGSRHAIAVASGTAALDSTIFAAGVEPGDEVITTPLVPGYVVTPILHLNAIPVFVDVDPRTLCIAPEAIEPAITPGTRAIMVVHVNGHPADMDPILEVAARHDLVVIEDCAHSQGSSYRGRPTGTIGQLGAVSLQSIKNLPCGEGGMVVTDDDELYERASLVGHHPVRLDQCLHMDRYRRYRQTGLGWNYRMHLLAAAIGLVQMRHFDAMMALRRRNAERISEGLTDVAGVTGTWVMPGCVHTYYAQNLFYEAGELGGVPLGAFLEALRAEGVPAYGIGDPVHEYPLFQDKVFYGKGCPWSCPYAHAERDYQHLSFPNVEAAVNRTFILGVGGFVTEDTAFVEQIIEAFRKVTGQSSRIPV